MLMRPQHLVTLASLLLAAPIGIFLPTPHTDRLSAHAEAL